MGKAMTSGQYKRRSQLGEIWRRFKKNRLATISLVILMVIVLSVIFADFIAPYDYAEQDIRESFQFPNMEHLLGTDNFGRDILSRIIYGGRISLLISLLAAAISLLLGIFLGATAGYFAGIYDTIVMRLVDIIMAIPAFLLAVSISAALGPGKVNTAIAIAVGGIPSYTRLVRAQVLTLKNQEFVESARASGGGQWRIVFRHILPNALSPVIVSTTLRLGANILQIASLSFIGLGILPPEPEWGSIMAAGRQYIRSFWPLVTFPGLAIMITLFAFNLFGDGLRDALDPRLKQ